MGKMVGNGTTVQLGTDGAVLGVQSCDMPNFAGDDVEVTDLDSVAFREYLYGGLADGGEITLEVFQDATGSVGTQGLVQLITVTNTDGTATRSIQGTGYIRERSLGTASPAEAIVGTMVLKFDGIGTPPSVTHPA